MTLSSYQRLVRSSAIYDILLTSAFAVPVLASLKLDALRWLHTNTDMAGSFPAFDPMHLFFVHLLGSIVTIWSLLRVFHPHALLGWYDALARFAFSIAMAWGLLQGGTELLWWFLIPELAWGIVQLHGYYRQQEPQPALVD